MQLHATNDRFYLEVPYALRDIPKSIPNHKWDPERKVWYWPKNLVNFLILKDHKPDLQIDRATTAWLREATREPVITIPEPAGLARWSDLRTYQQHGVCFLEQVGRVLLSDDVGLGKSPQSIMASLACESPVTLVLCPKSLIFNWESEISLWGQGQVVSLTGPASSRAEAAQQAITDHDRASGPLWLLANWETLRYCDMTFREWPTIIGDEAHRLRNRKTDLSIQARRLKAERLWLLTATPIQNTAEDLWAPLNWLRPKEFTSFWDFFEAFIQYQDSLWGREVLGSKNLEALYKIIRPFTLRRDKSHLNLPELSSFPVQVRLDRSQKTLYEKVEHDILIELEDDEKLFIPGALARLTRLKQAATAPQTFDAKYSGGAAKLDVAHDLIMDNPHKQFVVYSQYAEVLRIFEAQLGPQVGVGFLHGAVSSENRQKIVNAFRSGTSRVLLATLGTGGEGLNFTPCSDAIVLDHWWNPQVMHQAEGRLHRFGQAEPVVIHNLIAQGTIDEAIQRILRAKRDTADRVMTPLEVLKEHYGTV